MHHQRKRLNTVHRILLNADVSSVDQVAGNVENGRLAEHTLYVGIFKLPPQKLQEVHCQLLQCGQNTRLSGYHTQKLLHTIILKLKQTTGRCYYHDIYLPIYRI